MAHTPAYLQPLAFVSSGTMQVCQRWKVPLCLQRRSRFPPPQHRPSVSSQSHTSDQGGLVPARQLLRMCSDCHRSIAPLVSCSDWLCLSRLQSCPQQCLTSIGRLASPKTERVHLLVFIFMLQPSEERTVDFSSGFRQPEEADAATEAEAAALLQDAQPATPSLESDLGAVSEDYDDIRFGQCS